MKCAITYYTIIPMPSQFGRGKDAHIYGIVYALMLLAPIQLVQLDIAVACPSFLTIVSLAVPAKKKAFWP